MLILFEVLQQELPRLEQALPPLEQEYRDLQWHKTDVYLDHMKIGQILRVLLHSLREILYSFDARKRCDILYIVVLQQDC